MNVLEWDIYIVNAVFIDADGFVHLQPDGWGDRGGEAIYSMSPTGIHASPRDPDVDAEGHIVAGCNMLVSVEGGKQTGFPHTDVRAIAKLPKLKPGGTVLFGDTGKRQLPHLSFDGTTGSAVQYVPYAFDGSGQPTKAMAISIDVDSAGQERIQIVHGGGASISLLADNSVSVVAADKGASVTVENGGKVVVNGNTTVQGAVLMGNPAAAQPLAIAPALSAYLTALEADIATALTAIGAGSAAAGAAGASSFTGSAAARATLKGLIAAHLTSGA